MAQILYQNIETGDAHDITTLVKSASWKTKRTGSPAQLSLTLVTKRQPCRSRWSPYH